MYSVTSHLSQSGNSNFYSQFFDLQFELTITDKQIIKKESRPEGLCGINSFAGPSL